MVVGTCNNCWRTLEGNRNGSCLGKEGMDTVVVVGMGMDIVVVVGMGMGMDIVVVVGVVVVV